MRIKSDARNTNEIPVEKSLTAVKITVMSDNTRIVFKNDALSKIYVRYCQFIYQSSQLI